MTWYVHGPPTLPLTQPQHEYTADATFSICVWFCTLALLWIVRRLSLAKVNPPATMKKWTSAAGQDGSEEGSLRSVSNPGTSSFTGDNIGRMMEMFLSEV